MNTQKEEKKTNLALTCLVEKQTFAPTLTPASLSWLRGEVARERGGLAEVYLFIFNVSYLWCDLSDLSERIDI